MSIKATSTLEDSLRSAQTNLTQAQSDIAIEELVEDKGYHSTDLLDKLNQHTNYRSYIAEPKRLTGKRNWKGVSVRKRKTFETNRRRN